MAPVQNIALAKVVYDTILRKPRKEYYNLSSNSPGKLDGMLPIFITPFPSISAEVDPTTPLGNKTTLQQYLNSELSTRSEDALKWSWQIYNQTIGIKPLYITNKDIKDVTIDLNDTVGLFYGTSDPDIAYEKELKTYPEDNSTKTAYINIDNLWSNDWYLNETYTHETGHALGLKHPGDYNLTLDISQIIWKDDSWDESIMSYVNQEKAKDFFRDSNAGKKLIPLTPRTLDFIALDIIYGDQTTSYGPLGTSNAFTGDTTYGFNTTISSDESYIYANMANLIPKLNAFTIVDSGGFDTIDLSGYDAVNVLDLRVMTGQEYRSRLSTINNLRGALTLAVNTVIEQAIGGSADDTFYDNQANNFFSGNAGDDNFILSTGNDTVDGGDGIDTIKLSGARADYTITFEEESQYIITSNNSNQTVTARNIETVSFNNGYETVDLTTPSLQESTTQETDSLTGLTDDKIKFGKGEDAYSFADEFQAGESPDKIINFKREDEIDLRSIDANTTEVGYQTFNFIGTKKFSGEAAQLRYSRGILSADTDGDGGADLAVFIKTKGDFEFGIGNIHL